MSKDIMADGTQRTAGRNAQQNNILAARLIANMVKSTLGPRGMDKMLVDGMGDIIITNDGATIMREIDVSHPAARMVIEVAKTQESTCGDGTTSSVVLTGELLHQAESLIEQGIHPTTIVRGYNLASKKAIDFLYGLSRPVESGDLLNIANTSLASKSASVNSDVLNRIIVDAVSSIHVPDEEIDLSKIIIRKVTGGSISETTLINGIVLDKERIHRNVPAVVADAKIAFIHQDIDNKGTTMNGSLNVESPEQLQAFLQHEDGGLRAIAQTIIETGANVVFAEKGVNDLIVHLLGKAGIMVVNRVRRSDLDLMARMTGGEVVNSVDELEADCLGNAGNVEERAVGDEKFIFITDAQNSDVATIMLRGGTEQVLAEIERALDDALSVVGVALEDGSLIPGGGATQTELALKLREYAPSVGGREQMAVESFATALEVIPRTLADNAGLNEIDVILALRKAHSDGEVNVGINVFTGNGENMDDLGVVEPLRVGIQEIISATDASNMILRIDDVVAAKGGDGVDF